LKKSLDSFDCERPAPSLSLMGLTEGELSALAREGLQLTEKMKMATMVSVPVKPAVESKINWVALMGPIASMLAWWGLNVTPEVLLAIVMGVQAGQSLFTMVLRTYYSRSVTTSSAPA
jgi:hypothetical protein